MIGKLGGIVDFIGDDFLIVDVNGVGYRVFCSPKVLALHNSLGNKISLLIETVVKEDSITLFGFENSLQRVCFNTLCKVSGVGSKVALKIMGVAEVDEIISAIIEEDKNVFCRASGVGAKVALRIINELKNCQMVRENAAMGLSSGIIKNNSMDLKTDVQLAKDAIGALEGLGYQKNSVHNLVLAIIKEKPQSTLEEIITESLRKINNF